MRAIVHTGEASVELQELDRPAPGPEEVLVDVQAAGLCGSDAHAYTIDDGYEWIELPRIMGHEYAGIVRKVGTAVTTFSPGDHVVEEPIHDCGECFQCRNGQENVCHNFSITGMHRDGAYSDYTTVDAQHLHRIPETIPFEHAAVTEPTSIATRAIFEQSQLAAGDRVLVEGPGPIGALTALIADAVGATVTVSGLDRDAEARLPLLAELGIETIDVSERSLPEYADEVTDDIGFDLVFDTTGHHAGVEQAAEVVRKGGQIVTVGIPGEPSRLTMGPLVRGEVDLNTSYGSTWSDFERAIRIMDNGAIDFDRFLATDTDITASGDVLESFLAGEVCKPVFRFDDAD
jgi:L-iditol 2-dehydrogenase